MKVIRHLRGVYYLLKDEDHLILDVNSGRGAVGFSISIKLNEEQEIAYLEKGNIYLEELAEHVHQNQTYYWENQIDQDKQKSMHSTIMRWLKENNITL